MRRLLAWVLILLLGAGLGGAQDTIKEADASQEDTIGGKAALTIDNGGHVGAIGGMVFTADGKKLITVGHDYTIQEYDAASGERVRVIRPPSGQTVGDRLNGVAFLGGLGKAVKGKKVLAVIGTGIQPSANAKADGRLQRLFLFQREMGKIVGPELENLKTGALGLEALARAPGSPMTAVAGGETILIHKLLNQLVRNAKSDARKPSQTLKVAGARVRSLAFSPDGTRLAATAMDKGGRVLVWSMAKNKALQLLADRPVETWGLGLAWLPGGKQFVTTHRAKQKQIPLRLWSADGKPEKTFTRAQLSSRLSVARPIDVHQVVLRSESEAVLSVHWMNESPSSSHLVLAVDLQSGRTRELFYQGQIAKQHIGAAEGLVPMALSPDRNLLAVAVKPWGSHIAWIDLTGKDKPRFSGGPPTPAPEQARASPIGWSRDGASLAWYTRTDRLRNSLNLKKLTWQPVPKKHYDFLEALSEQKDGWKVEAVGGKAKRPLQISHRGKPMARVRTDSSIGTLHDRFTLSPSGSKPWLAWTENSNLYISDPATGQVRHHLRPLKSRIFNLAPSPDGRYLAARSSRELIYIYRIAGTEKFLSPLLTIYVRDQDWIVWTQQGYYAATPGGERLMGWTINNGYRKPATFHPASRFRKLLYRPELIPLVLEKGDVASALAALPREKTELALLRSAKVDDLLPPTIEILSIDTAKSPTVTLKVKAKASGPGQPVTSLRLMLNSRPLPDEKYHVSLGEKGKPEHEQTWTFEAPEGNTELSVLARSPDSLAVSETRKITFKQPPAARLFALCVGVNQYKQARLNLKAACNDAEGVAAALKKHCAKPPLFASATTDLLLDKKATKKGVLDALAALRVRGADKTIKPTDLVVLFFAGHGVKQGRDFYLLTHDADLKDLPKSCISGGELRKALSEFPCQVLLLLDACHSGAVGGALGDYRAATDVATRTLTDEEVGVVVLAAAMDYEHAQEKGAHGLFASALIDGLARAQGVPCNFRDKHIYIHHLFSYAFDRVKDRSEDKQHPSLNLPSTVESFPLVP